jgi:putative PEP-CTERM system TPR-repeat lipoprotein
VYIQNKDDSKGLADIDASLKVAPQMPLALYYKALVAQRANDVQRAWGLAQNLPSAFVNSRPEISLGVSQIAINAGHLEIGTSMLASAVANFPKSVEARVMLGSRYLELRDAGRAVQVLQPIADSSDPRVVLLLAQAYDMQHEYSKSVEYLEKASSAGVGGDALKRQIAITNLQGGKVDAAVAELEKLNAANPADPQFAGPLIAALIRKNDFSKAQEITEKLALAAPTQPYAPYFQGQLSLRKGDLDTAISAFSRAIDHDGKFIPALYERAAAYGARGDLNAAETDIRSILSIAPTNMMAEINLAQFALRKGQKDTAEAALKQAVAAHPKEPLPVLILASLEMQQGRFDDANAAVTGLLTRVPDNPNGIAMRAEIQMASGKLDEAVRTLRDLGRAQPKSPEIQILLAAALSKSGERQEAVDAYQRALELSPSSHAAHLGLIQLALANKDEAAALAAAQNYTEKQPGPLSAETLASTYVSLNKIGDAVNVLLRTQEKYPNSATLVSLTALLRAQGNAAKADSMLSDWIEKHAADVNVRMAYAGAQMRGDPAAAEIQYRAVLQVQPYNAAALNNLAWLLQKKKPEEALTYAERASKIAPDSASVLDTLAWTKWLINDKNGALPLLERAHASDAANGEIAYHLVLALDANGRREDAKKLLGELLASKSQFEDRSQAELLSAGWK